LIKSDLYFTHALRNVIHAALVGITVGLGPLRDALVYAPNGAEMDPGATGSTTAVAKQR
jgi:hypothetical protein